MERMNSLYLILFTELFLCFVSSVRSGSRSRLNQRITKTNQRIRYANERITNTEIRLDTVTHDVAVFRLDIRSIWEHLGQLNTSCHKNCGSSVSPAVEISNSELSVKSDQERRMFTAFMHEKQAVRNMFRRIDKNVTNIQEQILEDIRAFQQSHTHEKTELNKKISKIENSAKDFKSLDEKTKSALWQQEKRIESLEKEMNGYKTALETKNEELIDVKLKITEMELFNEKALNNLYKPTDCPPKWHKYSGSCYYSSSSATSSTSDTKTTWIEAKKNCQKEGAHLVEYDGVDEVKFVLSLVSSTDIAWSQYYYSGFWAGGSDLDKEGVWVWSWSGRIMDTGFLNWETGQPDNYRGHEDCLMSYINMEGRLNDVECQFEQRYVCEKALLL